MKPHIRRWFEDSAEIKLKFAAEHAERIEHVAALLVETFRRGNKILLFGNGGSAMDASHLAAELPGIDPFRMRSHRDSLSRRPAAKRVGSAAAGPTTRR